MDWFERIFGFKESQANIDKFIRLESNDRLRSLSNNRTFNAGKLEIISVKELRESFIYAK
jgi:hypothetical protein